MKVYIVIGDNNEWYEDNVTWNDAVFASEEAAKNYIEERPYKFEEDYRRIWELEKITDYRELTDAERKEWRELNDRWYWCNKRPSYRIEEFELQE